MEQARFYFQGVLFILGKDEVTLNYYVHQYIKEGGQLEQVGEELFEGYHAAEQAFTTHVSNALASRNEA